MEGITSSTIKMVVSSRQVVSGDSPVVVRVVMPRTTETTPATLSRGVTPPRTSRSMSLSLYCWERPCRPVSSAPLKGRAGSLWAAMAPATAAAAVRPDSAVPSSSVPPGATKTTRSLFRAAALEMRLVTVSLAAPPTTAIRSRRAADAAATLSRRSCWSVWVVLSHTTTLTFSCPSRTANPAS